MMLRPSIVCKTATAVAYFKYERVMYLYPLRLAKKGHKIIAQDVSIALSKL